MRRREFLKLLSLTALHTSVELNADAKDFKSDVSARWFEGMRPLMGSFTAVAVYTKRDGRQLIDNCFSFMEQELRKISDWEEESDTSQLRRERCINRAQCSPNLIRLAATAKEAEETSGRLFNPLTYGLGKLWREAKQATALPHPADIKQELERSRNSYINLDDDVLRLCGASSFDLGGVGKGFMADLACEYLRAQGVEFARVACSGDMRLVGDTTWRIDIEHPRKDGILRSFHCHGDIAVATSGDYRNCWEARGERLHHLIDSTTGYPGRHCQQATVIHPSATLADALATATFFLPPPEGIRFLTTIPQARGIIVSERGEIHASHGIDWA